MSATIRDAAFDVLRRRGLTTIFANPGSTEIPLLTDLPDDLTFRLGLHEGSVVGMATGYATATGRPACVLLHAVAGLGNAVGALATARANRTPLVVIVGQQDRRHLADRPFLSGDVAGLAGAYPVWTSQPARPADVPGTLDRAWHEARDARGPALVVVPSDDWAHEAAAPPVRAPAVLSRGAAPDPERVTELADLLGSATAPALVVGADADDPATWAGLTSLAEHLRAPVWQEAFAARAGFPEDHRRFAGHLPAGRERLRAVLEGHDVVLVVGAPVFRQFGYEPGPFLAAGVRTALVTDDLEDAHHSPVDLAVVADPAAVVAAVLRALPGAAGPAAPWPHHHRRTRPRPETTDGERGGPLSPAHVLAGLGARLPDDAVVVEETPSSRADLHRHVPTRCPGGFLSAAEGGLGFALPAAVGMRMGAPRRPVVAVVGDGSSLYAVQALWSAAHYDVGILVIVLANGRYAIMDELARQHGGTGPWPSFAEVDVSALAQGLGCPARRVRTAAQVDDALDTLVPQLAWRRTPQVLEVVVGTPQARAA